MKKTMLTKQIGANRGGCRDIGQYNPNSLPPHLTYYYVNGSGSRQTSNKIVYERDDDEDDDTTTPPTI